MFEARVVAVRTSSSSKVTFKMWPSTRRTRLRTRHALVAEVWDGESLAIAAAEMPRRDMYRPQGGATWRGRLVPRHPCYRPDVMKAMTSAVTTTQSLGPRHDDEHVYVVVVDEDHVDLVNHVDACP